MSETKRKQNPELGVLFFENPAHLTARTLEQHRSETLQRLDGFGLTVNTVLSVDTHSDTNEVVSRLQKADPDLLLCSFTSWVEEYLPIRVLNLIDIPIFLWSIPNNSAFSLLSGITAAASNLRQLGRAYFHGIGTVDSNEVFQEIGTCTMAAFLKRRIRQIRIGLFGQNCPGMIDVGGDDMALAALGPEVIRYELSDLMEQYDLIPEDTARISAKDLVEAAEGGVESGSEELLRAARMYLALKEKVEKARLDFVGVRCWPELRSQFKVSPCLAFSRLMDQGIMGICENDPSAGITMWLLHCVSGEAVFLGDMGRMDRAEGTLSLCHCGVASPSLAENRQDVHIKRYVLDPEGGQCIEFRLKRGPVTLAKLMRSQGGIFSMFIARGESVEGPEHRGSVIYVRPEARVDRFVSKMLEEGTEHHIVVGYGDLVNALVRWCHLMQIRVISP